MTMAIQLGFSELAGRRDRMGNTALSNAVCGGQAEIVKTLLQCHASPDVRCSRDRTPLMHAIVLGHQGIASLLLEGRASVDVMCRSTTGRSRTALMYAILYRKFQDVDVLLSHDASVHVTDEQGYTPLMIAVKNRECPDNVVRALLHAGSSCSYRVACGVTAKDLACRNHRRVMEQHELETLVLTLHVSVFEPGDFFEFTCTSMGGEELASGICELHLPIASLYSMIASELQGESFGLILPDGRLLANNVQMLCDTLIQRA